MNPKIDKCELSVPEQEAIAHRIQSWNRRITDLDDLQGGGGSGIAICVGDRFFIATAAHVIEANHRYSLATRRGVSRISKFVNKTFDCATDVGLLELDPNEIAKNESYASINDLATDYNQRKCREVIISGYPGSLLKKLNSQGILATASIVATETVLPDDWPSIESDRPISLAVDLLLKYPEHLNYQILGKNSHLSKAELKQYPTTEPRGLSGGGIWLSILTVSTQSGLVVPSPRLVGIQVSFVRKHRLLRATRITHWVRLLASTYQDIRIERADTIA